MNKICNKLIQEKLYLINRAIDKRLLEVVRMLKEGAINE